MSSEAEFKAAKVEGPKLPVAAGPGANNLNRRILVIPITASSAAFDILGDLTDPRPSTVGYTTTAQLPLARQHMVKLTADVDTYYAWSDNSGATISETAEQATTPQNQCDLLPSKVPTHEYAQGRYLVIKGSSTGRLRIVIASP